MLKKVLMYLVALNVGLKANFKTVLIKKAKGKQGVFMKPRVVYSNISFNQLGK